MKIAEAKTADMKCVVCEEVLHGTVCANCKTEYLFDKNGSTTGFKKCRLHLYIAAGLFFTFFFLMIFSIKGYFSNEKMVSLIFYILLFTISTVLSHQALYTKQVLGYLRIISIKQDPPQFWFFSAAWSLSAIVLFIKLILFVFYIKST